MLRICGVFRGQNVGYWGILHIVWVQVATHRLLGNPRPADPSRRRATVLYACTHDCAVRVPLYGCLCTGAAVPVPLLP